VDLGPEFGLTNGTVSFLVEPGCGTDLVFPLHAPAQVGSVLIKAVARTDNLSDGEQRLLPILPGRMHLMQSRFAALDDSCRRELNFSMMEDDDDSTRIQNQLIRPALPAGVPLRVYGADAEPLPVHQHPGRCFCGTPPGAPHG
jgi:hypothetical protein